MSNRSGVSTHWNFAGIQLAAFWDSGIAWTKSNPFAANDFINGYGVAFRLNAEENPGVDAHDRRS